MAATRLSASRQAGSQWSSTSISRIIGAIAIGSASELEYNLLLARDLKLIKPKDHAERSQRAIELKRILTALLQKPADR